MGLPTLGGENISVAKRKTLLSVKSHKIILIFALLQIVDTNLLLPFHVHQACASGPASQGATFFLYTPNEPVSQSFSVTPCSLS